MKILLVQPPFTVLRTETKKCHPPLGLAYLAGVLKQNHSVIVLDAVAEGYNEEEVIDKHFLRYGLSFENIKRRIEYLKPDIVGVSCLFSAQSENVHKICELVKEMDKKIVTILGGAHPSAVPEKVLKDNNVDFVVIGEGENTLNRILEFIEKRKAIQKNDIDGIGFRLNGDIRINKKERYETDLDNIPFPYWDIFPLEKYFKINNPHGGQARRTPFLPLISSRGCPFECIFCSIHNLWGRNYRKRSAENVLLEIEYLIQKFGIKEIMFEDDNLTLDKERATRIFQGLIETRINIIWSAPNGLAIQTLDDRLLELMRRSGCYRISIGIESGDEYVLKNIIGKPIVLSKIKPIINKARKLKMETSAFFVIGLPGETRKNLKNTLHFAANLGVDNVNFFFATPLPGTQLLELCKERGLIKTEINYINLKSDYPNFSTEYFSCRELNSIVVRYKLMIHLLSLLKKPHKFIYKVFTKLKYDPKYIFRLKLQLQNKKYKNNNNIITTT